MSGKRDLPSRFTDRRWLTMIPEPRPRVVPWCAGAIGGLMIASHVWAFGVGRAEAHESPAASDPGPILTATAAPALDPTVLAAPAPLHASTPPAPVVNDHVEPAPVPKARPQARPPEPPPSLTAREARRARQAARDLRNAVDTASVVVSPLVFARPVELDGSAWDEAAAACDALVVDAVAGWRLPTRREAGELRGRVPTDVVWTKTISGRDPEAAWVYDLDRGRAAVWLKMEPTASTVCVQPRPR